MTDDGNYAIAESSDDHIGKDKSQNSNAMEEDEETFNLPDMDSRSGSTKQVIIHFIYRFQTLTNLKKILFYLQFIIW